MTALEQPTPGGPLEAALAAHARAWRVFPVEFRGKVPAGNWGTMTASPQTEQIIRMWFGGEPRNVGIAAKASGLVMLDEDEAGALERACAAYGQPVPDTYRVQTSRGLHWYFTALEGRTIGNGAGALRAFHIDVRGGGAQHGGYVVGAGSVHESGHVYAALVPDQTVIPLPEWIADLLDQPVPSMALAVPVMDTGVPALGNTPSRPRTYTPAQAREWIERYAGVPLLAAENGTVNETLNIAAQVCGHFVPAFWTEDRARDYLVATLLAGPGARNGWATPDAKDLGTIRSGLGAGMADWRAIRAPELVVGPMDQPAPAVDEATDPDGFRAAVEMRKAALRIREVAAREYERERRPAQPPAGSTTLTALLAESDDGPRYLVDGLWPAGGKVLLAAPQKAGKTTLVGNLVRSLVDGAPFLAKPVTTLEAGDWKVAAAGYAVPEVRRVFVLDFEMTRRKLREWLLEQRIINTGSVHVELMRGRSWDIRDDDIRAEWAAHLRATGAGVLVVDPIGPVLHGLGIDENDNSAVGGFLAALDALVREAGVSELFVVHHAGHGSERARGASSFLGWPDANWRLVRAEMTDIRGFAAEGRDVWVPEIVLEFERTTRRLWLGQGNREDARGSQDVAVVVEIVQETPGLTQNDVRRLIVDAEGWGKPRAENAIHAARGSGLVHVHPGQNRARFHHVGQSCPECAPSGDPGL